MKKHLNATVIITLILAVLSVIISANHNKREQSKQSNPPAKEVMAQSTPDEETEEMRGLWVSYISLDMNNTDMSEESFRKKFDGIIQTAKEYGCNTLFVHVRAFCDAFYNSDYFPSSHILWGNQGEKANYDSLKIMCEMCKKENLKIHAWINPFRVTTDKSSFGLSDKNPYVTNPDICTEHQGGIYLNPAISTARKLIVDGVREIIENYDVDGIHFDDYFYPTTLESFDKAQYNQYLKAFASERDALPLNEWRKNNVNLLIAEIYRTIKNTDPNIIFGISPQGNIQNDLEMGADVKSWIECMGYVDYVCPQLYYSLENPALKFEAGLDDWLEFDQHAKLKLYAGLAVYKAGSDADDGTWKTDDNILSRELEIIRSKNIDGFILYDYEALVSENAKKEMANFKEAL